MRIYTLYAIAAATAALQAQADVSPCELPNAEAATVSGSVRILAATDSFYWRTAGTPFTQAIAVPWPQGSDAGTSALLTMAGMNATKTVAIGGTNTASYSAPLPKKRDDEDIYRLVLDFEENGTTTSALTSTVAWVCGVQGAAGIGTRLLVTNGNAQAARKWTHAEKSNVLPLPQGTTQLRLDAATVSTGLDAPGWFAYSPVTIGMHSVALTAAGNVYAINLRRYPQGTIVILK